MHVNPFRASCALLLSALALTLSGCGGKSATCEAVCGDGVIECAEECDDGNTVDGDGCSSACALETCEDADADGHTDSQRLAFTREYSSGARTSLQETRELGLGWFGPTSNDLFDLK